MEKSIETMKEVIRQHFKKLSILITQIPFDVRQILLPGYMLYNGFKSAIYMDHFGKMGFEIYRERARRFSIKIKKIELKKKFLGYMKKTVHSEFQENRQRYKIWF